MSENTGQSYLFGPYRLDSSERLLLRGDQPVSLTPKVFDLLEILVKNHGHLVEKDALLTALWPDSFVEEGGLTRCVSVLRKALGDSAADQAYIETVPKRGYRFTAAVSEAGHASSSPERPSPLWRLATVAAGVLLAIVAFLYAARSGSPTPDTNPPAPLPPVVVHRQLTFSGTEGSPALSPEGGRLAYVSYRSTDRQVVIREREGGKPTVVFTAPEAGSLRWSPDGTALMFWARGAGKDGLHIVPTSGGAAERLGFGPAAAWSPDGSMIAVGLPVVGRISVLNRQGIQQRSISLAGVKRWISDIDWSANDLLLVVANDEQGRHTIWTVRPDGTQQTRIHVENAEISGARWARSGRAIYYHRRVEQTSSVYRLSLADHTSGQAKPTALITGLETDGSFGVSDDGRRLVYARAPYSSRLWAVDLPASGKFNARPLTGGTWRVERPRFSPDGKRLVFTVGYEARANLYIMPSDGGTPTQLTSLDGFNGGGVWSTDGRSIAFVSTSGGRPQVWRVGAEGGLPARLSPAPVSDSFALAWSSGTQILFHQPGNRNFLALDFLTGRTRPYFGDGSDGWIFSPTFSPDGRHVAVGWSRKNWGLWLIDTSDGSGRLVTKDAMLPIGWSPDGASIYVIDGKRAAYRDLTAETGETFTQVTVRRVSLSGRIEPVVDLPFGEVGGVALSPDARRLVCVVYSTGSDVWLVEPFDTLTDDR